MEYINFNLTVPLSAYLELENKAHEKRVTKNEIIVHAIFCHLASDSKAFDPLKNAGFENLYNKN